MAKKGGGVSLFPILIFFKKFNLIFLVPQRYPILSYPATTHKTISLLPSLAPSLIHSLALPQLNRAEVYSMPCSVFANNPAAEAISLALEMSTLRSLIGRIVEYGV